MYIFIVSSPRSGSTVLGEVFNQHPNITHWYEPYFIWDFYHGKGNDDFRDQFSLNEKAIRFIRNEFEIYKIKSGKSILIEKTPINAFKIDLIYKVFPKAKFIHLIRDGRDVTRSIYREWIKRKYYTRKLNPTASLSAIQMALKRQPFLRNKVQAIYYEIRTLHRFSTFLFKSSSSWNTDIGWGPRFPGWKDYRETHTLLEFCAKQWLECEAAIQNSLKFIPSQSKYEIRYENLVSNPENILSGTFNFIGIEDKEYIDIGNVLNSSKIGQFDADLDNKQQQEVLNIIDPMLKNLGYKE